MRIKAAAITTQCAWRGKVARRELRKLKMVSCRDNYVLVIKFKMFNVPCIFCLDFNKDLIMFKAEVLCRLAY